MIKKLVRDIARYILREELIGMQELIVRLQSYAIPHVPEILPDGTDQTYNFQYNLDVIGSVYLREGTYQTKRSTEISTGNQTIEGEI